MSDIKRPVGRPRQLDDDAERKRIVDAAYAALRDEGQDFTIATILGTAGVATRSFYRHFASKDALLCAMYRRDAEWAANRLARRLTEASSPVEAVTWWIDEMFSFRRNPRRAERVAVLRSVTALRAEGSDEAASDARRMLTVPLREAINAGVDDGSFRVDDPDLAAELLTAAVVHAAGLAIPHAVDGPLAQDATTAFCLHALGAR